MQPTFHMHFVHCESLFFISISPKSISTDPVDNMLAPAQMIAIIWINDPVHLNARRSLDFLANFDQVTTSVCSPCVLARGLIIPVNRIRSNGLVISHAAGHIIQPTWVTNMRLDKGVDHSSPCCVKKACLKGPVDKKMKKQKNEAKDPLLRTEGQFHNC